MVSRSLDVLKAIKTRRSIRSFKAKPITDEDAIKILEAARWAPSGGNMQSWAFIYVKDAQVLRMVKNCSPGFYGNAAASVVICVQDGTDAVQLLDVGSAAENILLAAHAQGLGGCAIASFNREAIKKIVNAPEGWEPILVVSLGYPNEVPSPPLKKPLSEIVYLDAFGKRWEILVGS